MTDPEKWVDDEDATPEERALLRAGRATELEPPKKDRIWALLSAKLPPIGGGGGGSAGGAGAAGAAAAAGGAVAGGAKLLTRAGVTAIVAGAIGITVVVAHGRGVFNFSPTPPASDVAVDQPAPGVTVSRTEYPIPAPPEATSAVAVASPPKRAPTPSPIVTSVATTRDEPSIPPAPSASPELPAAPPAPSASSPASTSTRLAAELRLVREAREALRSGDASGALSRLAEADRQFPGGLLGEEREMLKARALEGVGRRSEAKSLATRFLLAHPKSAYASAMRDLAEN